MRLVSSELALKVAIALAARDRLTLSDVARATRSSVSAAQRALEIVLDDEVVERLPGPRPLYRLTWSPVSRQVVALACTVTPLREAVALAARAAPAIEFVARERASLIAVLSARSPALDQSRAASLLDALAEANALAITCLEHDDVRRDLLVDLDLRDRMSRADLLHGSLDRTFPDRGLHRLTTGTPLHRAHDTLTLPGRTVMRRLSRQHQVASLRLFGSAVRTDFRLDSDVDVLVQYQAGVRPTLRSLIDLERALEAAFDRDVDAIRIESLHPEMRDRIVRDAVALA